MTAGRGPGAGLVFFPVGLALLLALVAFLLVVPLVALTVGEVLGLSPAATFAAFAAVVLGSAVNVPVREVEARVEVHPLRDLPLLGRFGTPAVERRRTIVAVNVGGAVVPSVLAVHFLAALPPAQRWAALASTVAVTIAVHAVAEPVPGLGIAVPTMVPPVASVGFTGLAYVYAGAPLAQGAPAAFTAGVLGTLAGADLLNLDEVARVGAPVVSIGGAGTFDGIVMSGVISTLLAALLLGAG